MSAPVVSVNICTYNSSKYVGETLDSVFAQTLQDFEIIIVDDGSTDGTPEWIESHYPDPRITIVRQRHVTLRVARPLALAHSRGEFIAFLDSDDLWFPTKLERHVEVARAAPDTGLIFSDCELIDASGTQIGYFSDQFNYGVIDFRGTRGHVELLRYGNFIASPTPFAPASAIRAVGGFNQSYRHVNDYELWLRLARHFPLRFIDQPLARYRIHDAQFTQRRPEITLPEQCALFTSIMRSASYPREVRIALGDNLLGQHRLAWRLLVKQRRYGLAVRSLLGMCAYPDRIRDYWRHKLSRSVLGPVVERGVAGYLQARNTVAQVNAHAVRGIRYTATRARRAPRRLQRVARGQEPLVRSKTTRDVPRDNAASATHVWIDGSSLGREQTGYFNLLSELIRRLAHHQAPSCVVHVLTQRCGREALLARLGPDGARIRFHNIGWRVAHWSHIHRLAFGWHAQLLVALLSMSLAAVGVITGSWIALGAAALFIGAQAGVLLDHLATEAADSFGRRRQRLFERAVRFLWRRWPAPRRRAPAPETIEVVFWRGRFKWRDSQRIAIVQDMTTRIHPELHTAGNVVEFDEFLGYVQRHAHTIATVSEQSKRDIIGRIAVCPDSVAVIPMPIHPQYVQPHFSRGFVAVHGITGPYVLCVGTIEPRKNLRRLVRAFELLKEEDAAKDQTLVLVGLQGWDDSFREFLAATDVCRRVRVLGFVPLEHLPSLYHFAAAVICPSVYEGFGIPVMEAMCSSGIVLASRVSALPEVLGEDGIQFDPYRTDDMASALLGALTLSPSDAAHYRRRCRRRAEAHFDRLADAAPLPGLRAPRVRELA